jgi:hypothetical protein
VLAIAAPIEPRESAVNPVRAFAAIPKELRVQPVLNEYSFGGPLIVRGIKVYMDGRTDLYGDDYFREYLRVWRGDPAAFERAERKCGFCWTMFPPDNKRLIALLDHRAGWKRFYSDKYAIHHVHDGCRGK